MNRFTQYLSMLLVPVFLTACFEKDIKRSIELGQINGQSAVYRADCVTDEKELSEVGLTPKDVGANSLPALVTRIVLTDPKTGKKTVCGGHYSTRGLCQHPYSGCSRDDSLKADDLRLTKSLIQETGYNDWEECVGLKSK